jgi:hypothetical protein
MPLLIIIKKNNLFSKFPSQKQKLISQSIKIEFLFSEFGAQRVNGGGWIFKIKALD